MASLLKCHKPNNPSAIIPKEFAYCQGHKQYNKEILQSKHLFLYLKQTRQFRHTNSYNETTLLFCSEIRFGNMSANADPNLAPGLASES